MSNDLEVKKRTLGLVVHSTEHPRRKIYDGPLGRKRAFARSFRVVTRDRNYESKLDREARELAETLSTFYWSLISLYGYKASPMVQLPLDYCDELLRKLTARILRSMGLTLHWQEVRDIGALRFTFARVQL